MIGDLRYAASPSPVAQLEALISYVLLLLDGVRWQIQYVKRRDVWKESVARVVFHLPIIAFQFGT